MLNSELCYPPSQGVKVWSTDCSTGSNFWVVLPGETCQVILLDVVCFPVAKFAQNLGCLCLGFGRDFRYSRVAISGCCGFEIAL